MRLLLERCVVQDGTIGRLDTRVGFVETAGTFLLETFQTCIS